MAIEAADKTREDALALQAAWNGSADDAPQSLEILKLAVQKGGNAMLLCSNLEQLKFIADSFTDPELQRAYLTGFQNAVATRAPQKSAVFEPYLNDTILATYAPSTL